MTRRMGRPLEPEEYSRIGVSKLRQFLEELLQRRYLESVPTIVPVLEHEYRSASHKLNETLAELNCLDTARLKERGREFRERFISKMNTLLRGTNEASAEQFGETLADEHVRGGHFGGDLGSEGVRYAQKALDKHQSSIPNSKMRLFGGAQYNRALSEFRQVCGGLQCPPIRREDIANACGVEDIHDGVNYVRTACVIAVAKAKEVFEPFLFHLGYRLAHIMRRVLPIVMNLLRKDGLYMTGHDAFMKKIASTYYQYIEETELSCREKCQQDLGSTTRFVTWSLHNKDGSSLRTFLRDHRPTKDTPGSIAGGAKRGKDNNNAETPGSAISDTENLVELLEATLWNRQMSTTSEDIVAALVRQIFEGIRDFFVTSTELKFNCFFLLPIIEEFSLHLRVQVEKAYEEDIDAVFNVSAVRANLESRKHEVGAELIRVERLKEKFAAIHNQLNNVRAR